jgi:hypothetical protein
MEESKKIIRACIEATQDFCSREMDAWNYHLSKQKDDQAKKSILDLIESYRAIKDVLEKMKGN